MSKNLRTSSAGSAPRACAVRQGAFSLKMGALISLSGALALSLVVPANAQVGGPNTLASTLTTTQVTNPPNQVLNLISTVTNGPGVGQFTWTFTLTNPFGNTVQIRAFTIAPRCDL